MSPKEITNSELKILKNPLDALKNDASKNQFDIFSKTTKHVNSFNGKRAMERTDDKPNAIELSDEDIALQEEDIA